MDKRKPTIPIKIVFWMHFLFAAVSHLILPLQIIGTIKLLILWSDIGFLETCALIGASLFSLTYLVNHVTNRNSGFCILTEWENASRSSGGYPRVGSFTPRFWRKVKQIIKGDFGSIP